MIEELEEGSWLLLWSSSFSPLPAGDEGRAGLVAAAAITRRGRPGRFGGL